MRLAFKIAVRFLKSNKTQTFLIALGIAVGISVQVFIGALIQGLQRSLIDKTIGNSSHVTVTSQNEDKTLENWDREVRKIKNADRRIKNISAAVDLPAFIRIDDKSNSILVRGFNFNDSDKIYEIRERMVQGKEPTSDDQAIIGLDLKKELNIEIGDKVGLITSDGVRTEVKICGIYDLKVTSINKSWVITNLETAQNILGLGNKITSIEMQVTDIFKADEIAKVIQGISDKDIKVENWKGQNAQLLSGLSGQSSSSAIIQVFVIVAVVLGISSVLAITVVQKSRQIGILKAMGIKDITASFIFLFQGLILGAMGAILGIGIGIGLLLSFSKFALNPDGTPVAEIYINARFITISIAVAIISSTLAALIPARKSSKLSPIEVIKNG
ncbi:MAG: ABC transporter permease [Clostridium lundense]|nr:ABC transporter permease [Clostridium lundense]